jgi:Zn-dependent M16 (insulinase) family peptidase
MLVVRGRPSAAMSERLETEEKKRVAEQISRLGEKGLEEQGKILADAKKANEEPMPDEKVEWIPVPDVRTISWISVQSASTISESNELQAVEENSKELAAYLESDKCILPYALHFDHISVSQHSIRDNAL